MAVERELLPAAAYQALAAVSGLKRGRTEAKESVPVRPVAAAAVDAVLPFLGRQPAAMVRLQTVTGMRPGEVYSLRPCDADATGDVWVFTSAEHKTEHHERHRVVFVGPGARRSSARG